jgi:hypothetical protein
MNMELSPGFIPETSELNLSSFDIPSDFDDSQVGFFFVLSRKSICPAAQN